jgi:superfamily I DNA/RNA helicase
MVNYYANVDIEAEPKVSLSTIHAAKGKESDRVVLSTELTPRIAESLAKAPDEEIRVFYVAVTRAKHRLDIINSGEFDIIGDSNGY